MSEENNIIDLDEENIVELEDEDGTKVLFELLDYFEYRKHDYVVLIPLDDEEGDSVVILQVEPVDEENEDPYYRAMEKELLDRINGLGIGPQGFGGRTTALSVKINAAPTHIAGLPVAVNVNCHVSRHKEEII